MKIEPMSVEDIKRYLKERNECDESFDDDHSRCIEIEKSLILAWAHERARRNRARAAFYSSDKDHDGWTESDWLSEVLDEIGWPKEER